jgi:hypothetical protein
VNFVKSFDFKHPTILYLDAKKLIYELDEYYPEKLEEFLKDNENSSKPSRF